jgi:hypothetical protein
MTSPSQLGNPRADSTSPARGAGRGARPSMREGPVTRPGPRFWLWPALLLAGGLGASCGSGGGAAGGAGGAPGAGGAASGGAGSGGTSTGGGPATGGAAGRPAGGAGGAAGQPASGGAPGSGGASTGSGGGGPPPVTGDELFVAPTGDDANPGTRDRPFRTIAAAQTAVRSSPDRGKVPITVTVLAGTYYVGKTIVFTSADSGGPAAPVTYRGLGAAILSGGVPLDDLTWTPYKSGIMRAAVPADRFANLSFDDGKAAPGLAGTHGFSSALFLNGRRQQMARYPNYKAGGGALGGGSAQAEARAGGWAHPPTSGQPAYEHGLHGQLWGGESYVITGASGGRPLQQGPLCNGRPAGLASGSQVIENAFDELDAPGEWYYDRTGLAGTPGTLYFYPPAGVDLTSAGSYTLEMAGVERIFELDGGCASVANLPSYPTASACAAKPPVQWLALDGFHYTDTLRTFPSCNETLLRSDWNIYRGGAVFITGGQHVTVSNSFFDQVGGAGVFVNGYDSDVAVTGNLFVGTGSSAILFIGNNKAVRDALIGYGAGSVPVNQLDMTPGPQTNDYPSACSATQNLIHDIGDPELQVAGVGIDMARDITVSHNSIYNVPRAGINVGDGCWGGHVISYNDVFATVLYTGDHGAYNSWGRDRYWDHSTGAIESRVGNDPTGLPLLDVVEPITLAHNRWRCDHGWDVDLDDGSTNYVITDNVFLSGGLKWREGYDRVADNNVFVKQDTTPCAANGTSTSGCMSVHVWPKNSNDVFTHNVFWGYDPVSPDGYGKQLDDNLFQSAAGLSGSAQLSAARGYGVDAHSAAGDPAFADAGSGNFQLGAGSAAPALGIMSLPADDYGVTVLALRAQAATPPFGPVSLGPVNPTAGNRDCTTVTAWRGATIQNLCGPSEESATGLGSEVGVYVQAVPAGSQAAADGFQPLDVILGFDGQPVAALSDLQTLYAATTPGQKLSIGIFRAQSDHTLSFTR